MISKPLLFLWVKGSSPNWHSLITLKRKCIHMYNYTYFAVGGIRPKYQYDNKELFEKLESAKTEEERKEIRSMIYLNNLAIVAKCMDKWFPGNGIRRFCNRHRITPDDLFSDISFALYRAIETFKGGKFTSYAGFCMDNKIREVYRYYKYRENVTTSLQEDASEEQGNSDKERKVEEVYLSIEDTGYNSVVDREEFERILPYLKRRFRRKNEAKVLDVFLSEVKKDAGDMLTQRQMAEVIGVSKSTVNKTVTEINKYARQIRRELDESELQRQTN
ncbi:hypothetical protein JL_70 [Bacillus phage JL]|uniref:Uncharacterized protein n=1 Tax=Bacillus phage JL TaxID=1296655 RepID=V5TGW0_9CAUD|nr:hypothetical protein AVV47_gp070 [Bacillus phage JL]AHB63466.1 hypothetical protein JL_70 [Bacillus phage JL]